MDTKNSMVDQLKKDLKSNPKIIEKHTSEIAKQYNLTDEQTKAFQSYKQQFAGLTGQALRDKFDEIEKRESKV